MSDVVDVSVISLMTLDDSGSPAPVPTSMDSDKINTTANESLSGDSVNQREVNIENKNEITRLENDKQDKLIQQSATISDTQKLSGVDIVNLILNSFTIKDLADFIISKISATTPIDFTNKVLSVPDNSITNDKISTLSKIGLLANLNTDDKQNIVNAINEVKETADNALENLGNYAGAFNTYADLLAYTGEKSNNDYAIVLSDETHSNACTRYIYKGAPTNAWSYQYKVNDTPFTQAQLDAINSGINATKVAQIATNTADILTKQDKLTAGTISAMTDTTNLSEVDLTAKTAKNITGALIRDYIQSKIQTDSSLTDSTTSGVKTIGLPSLVTDTGSTNYVYPQAIDQYGRVKGYGSAYDISNEYKTAQNNTLFTRNGAKAMYDDILENAGKVDDVTLDNISLLDTSDKTAKLKTATNTEIDNLFSDIPAVGAPEILASMSPSDTNDNVYGAKCLYENIKNSGHLYYYQLTTTDTIADKKVFDFSPCASWVSGGLEVIETKEESAWMYDPITGDQRYGRVKTTQFFHTGRNYIYIEQYFKTIQYALREARMEFYRQGYVALDNTAQYTNWVASKGASITWLSWIPREYPAYNVANIPVSGKGQLSYIMVAISGGCMTMRAIWSCSSGGVNTQVEIMTFPFKIKIGGGITTYYDKFPNEVLTGTCDAIFDNNNRFYARATTTGDFRLCCTIPLGY